MKELLASKIKELFWNIGIEIRRVKDKKPIIENVFKNDCKKKVLISYLKDPFIKGIDYKHTNLLECFTIAEIFNDLGFQVDVISLDSTYKVNYCNYDVICGQGRIYENSFNNDCRIKRIYYSTGSSFFYSEINTAKKVRDFYEKTKILATSSGRFFNHTVTKSIFLSDKVIVLGNNTVLDTFVNLDGNAANRYENLNAFYFDVCNIDLNKKNFYISKKHFLWFGSSGFLHKGLDLLIDIFSKRNDYFLHICGIETVYEAKVLNYYKPIITSSKNIFNHGFVNIDSSDFKNLMLTCSFVIFPSISEGGAVSVLNVVANGGLIPIVTKSVGLDVDEFGYIVDDSIFSINNLLDNINELSEQDIFELSIKAKTLVREHYTYDKYKTNLKSILSSCFDFK
ncbi:MAG: glycosyltransferase [Paludibacter sp.]|nr:glycosyltransferase [Paludibacter sp.]